jgi:hypothetical protein
MIRLSTPLADQILSHPNFDEEELSMDESHGDYTPTARFLSNAVFLCTNYFLQIRQKIDKPRLSLNPLEGIHMFEIFMRKKPDSFFVKI